ncbi:MAG: TonB family protein [Deltaproteobacteria bacterium]|nr:TonB family protein [Deltaproteobacteria bacterium]
MRYVQPSLAVFLIALLASLGVHLPIYSALGVLAEVMLESDQHGARRPIFFEPTDSSSGDEQRADSEKNQKDRLTKENARQLEDDLEKEAVEQKKEPSEVAVKPKQERRQERKPIQLQLIETRPKETIKIPPEVQNKLAVRQRSDNPDVEPPENSRFIAKENRRVEEETVAIVRNMHRDDPEPSARLAPGMDTGELGDADKFESADLEDREGSDERTATSVEAETEPSRPSQPSSGEQMAPAVDRASAPGASRFSDEYSRDRRAGAPQAGGDEQAIVVRDAMGTYRISPGIRGRGPGDEGGEYRPGAAAEERGDRSGSRKYKEGINLNLSWSQFEDTFGDKELKQERESYLQQRRSKSRGGSNKRWREFRAAIENFVSNVKPGNQTALNAAASPFAEYISAVHRRIHREFAWRFIAGLPSVSGPFADMSLNTTLEIVFNRDGSVHRIGFVKSSGFLAFDYGAFEAVLRAQPYPEPPPQILSGDGRVYVHWGFYRNHRMCGTFNVSPFILPNPPGTPRPDDGPLKDPLGS